ncbi:MAG: hypothetical protein IKZ13_03370 [Akkermansia sp.]|nr:hypothetical protein [Akkermansia sp.]
MTSFKLKDWLFVSALAFVLGLGWPHIYAWFAADAHPQQATTDEKANEPIKSDAFTFRLLKAAMQTSPEGNLLLAPNSLAMIFKQMHPLADPAVAQALDSLQLPENSQESAADIQEAACLFADPAAGLDPELARQYTYHASFSEDLATAFADINNALIAFTNNESALVANSDTVNRQTTLLAVNAINYTCDWLTPLSTAENSNMEFYNANGGIPMVRGMSCYAHLYATAPGGEWKAAAIRLKRVEGTPSSVPDCELLIIQPTQGVSARTFAAALTPEKFSEIRTNLRESTLSCEVKLPRLAFRQRPQNIIPTLQGLEIDALFTSATPFSKLTAKAPYPFETAYQQINIIMQEAGSRGEQLPPQTDTLTCDRPFMWFLMPLSSSAPPHAAGILDNL